MRSASIAFVAASTLMAATAMADEGRFAGRAPQTEVVIGEDTYGTGDLTAHQVGSYQFQPLSAATPLTAGSGVSRFFTVPSAFAYATPMLPNGAQIERIEVRACDTDAGAEIRLLFGPCTMNGGLCALAGSVQTGIAAIPGCNNFSTTLAAPVIVNNATQVLFVEVRTGTTSSTNFSAVNLYYRLRVSPAPGTATFPNDVPTSHPFFRFVEALAAAGITGGCGAGAYCPDTAVTRGQMAVFLATALGLHFPN